MPYVARSLGVASWGVTVVFVVVLSEVASRTGRLWATRAHAKLAGRCDQCGYKLDPNASADRCPECGATETAAPDDLE